MKVAVFDLDGTLVDAFADIAAAINTPLMARGEAPHSLERVRGWVGDGAARLVERATPARLQPEIDAIREEMLAYYSRHPADLARVYEGILPVLDALQRHGVALAVLSNKPEPMAVDTLAQLGLLAYFGLVLGDDASGRRPRKPHPDSLRAVLDHFHATQAVMIGDGQPDAEVAMRAGVPFVACLWGTRTREQLSIANPVGYATHPLDLLPLVRQALHLPPSPENA